MPSKKTFLFSMWVICAFPPTILFLLKYQIIFGLLFYELIPSIVPMSLLLINSYLITAYGKIMSDIEASVEYNKIINSSASERYKRDIMDCSHFWW